MRRLVMLSLLILLSGLFVSSRFYPTLKRVEVRGNIHYSQDDIMRLANVAPGEPFFWVTRSRLKALAADPWINAVYVERHWPDTVIITVSEKSPSVTDGLRVYALDGTVLPGATRAEKSQLIRLSGWGEDRFEEALALLRQVAEFGPKVLSYSPAGFQIQLAEAQLFTPSLANLRAHWASFSSQQGTRVYVYPWGVSAAHD